MTAKVAVIGGGLAGCEAAWQVARLTAGKASVDLFEMRPGVQTPAHSTGSLAELVCSNSLKSEAPDSPAGLLKEELAAAGSLIIRLARRHRVPAGKALAVDRTAFALDITHTIETSGAVNVIRREMDHIPQGYDRVIVATGPLTSPAMERAIKAQVGEENLYFYDAIAPIIEAASIDMSIAFIQDRYGPPGCGDYLNLPMGREEYYAFVDALLAAGKTEFKDFEKEYYFEGCLPIEEIAGRGRDSLAFGPLKPVGLENPATGQRPWAVVQLRKEDADGLAYNMVGFQTKLKTGEQERVFRMIPGMAQARLARHGSLHRNTFIDSPKSLDGLLRLKQLPHVRLAGQMTGVEGYVESTACGFLAGALTAWEIMGAPVCPPPRATAMGALLSHVSTPPKGGRFQPSNINLALFLPLEKSSGGKKERRRQVLERAREERRDWLTGQKLHSPDQTEPSARY